MTKPHSELTESEKQLLKKEYLKRIRKEFKNSEVRETLESQFSELYKEVRIWKGEIYPSDPQSYLDLLSNARVVDQNLTEQKKTGQEINLEGIEKKLEEHKDERESEENYSRRDYIQMGIKRHSYSLPLGALAATLCMGLVTGSLPVNHQSQELLAERPRLVAVNQEIERDVTIFETYKGDVSFTPLLTDGNVLKYKIQDKEQSKEVIIPLENINDHNIDIIIKIDKLYAEIIHAYEIVGTKQIF